MTVKDNRNIINVDDDNKTNNKLKPNDDNE